MKTDHWLTNLRYSPDYNHYHVVTKCKDNSKLNIIGISVSEIFLSSILSLLDAYNTQRSIIVGIKMGIKSNCLETTESKVIDNDWIYAKDQ